MSKRGGSGKRSGEGDLGFEAFSFGSIRINGTTYEYDVMIDRGHVSKRNKKPSKKFRSAFGAHTALNRGGYTLEVPAAGCRYGYRSLAHHGRGETRSRSPRNRIGHTGLPVVTQSIFSSASRRETLGKHSKGDRRGGGLKIDWTKPLPSAWPMCIDCPAGSRMRL